MHIQFLTFAPVIQKIRPHKHQHPKALANLVQQDLVAQYRLEENPGSRHWGKIFTTMFSQGQNSDTVFENVITSFRHKRHAKGPEWAACEKAIMDEVICHTPRLDLLTYLKGLEKATYPA